MRVKIGDGSGCLPVSNSALSSGLGLSPFVESCRRPSLEPWETGISPRKIGRVSTPDGWIVPWLWCRGFQHASASDGEAGCRGSSGYWPASMMRTSWPRSRRPAAASCSPRSSSTSCTASASGTRRPPCSGEQEIAAPGMSRDQRRRDAVRVVIENEPAAPASLQHIHSVLALCGLPYRDPGAVARILPQYGRNSLSLIAGRIKDPETGAMDDAGASLRPEGAAGPAAPLHRGRAPAQPDVEGRRDPVGLHAARWASPSPAASAAPSGSSRSSSTGSPPAPCRSASGTARDSATHPQRPAVPQPRICGARRPARAPSGWSKTVQFHQEFYENLIRHALPVDIRAARAFSGSARKLDLLFWVGYRLRALQRPLRLTWEEPPRRSSGPTTPAIRSFRQAFKADVAHLREVFPRLPIELDDNGMLLHPADASTLLIPPRTGKAGRRAASDAA